MSELRKHESLHPRCLTSQLPNPLHIRASKPQSLLREIFLQPAHPAEVACICGLLTSMVSNSSRQDELLIFPQFLSFLTPTYPSSPLGSRYSPLAVKNLAGLPWHSGSLPPRQGSVNTDEATHRHRWRLWRRFTCNTLNNFHAFGLTCSGLVAYSRDRVFKFRNWERVPCVQVGSRLYCHSGPIFGPRWRVCEKAVDPMFTNGYVAGFHPI